MNTQVNVASGDVELVAKLCRRPYPAEYKRGILGEARPPATVGALLRRQRLYSSVPIGLEKWRLMIVPCVEPRELPVERAGRLAHPGYPPDAGFDLNPANQIGPTISWSEALCRLRSLSGQRRCPVCGQAKQPTGANSIAPQGQRRAR